MQILLLWTGEKNAFQYTERPQIIHDKEKDFLNDPLTKQKSVRHSMKICKGNHQVAKSNLTHEKLHSDILPQLKSTSRTKHTSAITGKSVAKPVRPSDGLTVPAAAAEHDVIHPVGVVLHRLYVRLLGVLTVPHPM